MASHPDVSATAGSREDLRQALEGIRHALPRAPLSEDSVLASASARLERRIQRDLLPRLGAAHPGLLVAIAGPNNAGKSTAFNALVGAPLSPARAVGGLTRQPLAIAHPSFLTPEVRAVLERRFDLREISESETKVVTETGTPGTLHLVSWPALRFPQLLLMDLPDFDSIYAENRQSAEAVLLTVDLLLFVVTRQTYQNAALVEFLREAVGRGKPYVLVYNEASSDALAREHLDKLAADVGVKPLARWIGRHDPRVETGEATLALRPLDDSPEVDALFSDATGAAALKTRAFEASLEDARRDLTQLRQQLSVSLAPVERLRQRMRYEIRSLSERAARRAVPADVLLEAFRDELDARSPRHRVARWVPRKISNGLSHVGRTLRGYLTGPDAPPQTPASRSAVELADGLRKMQAALAPELRAWTGDAATLTALEESLGPRLNRALEAPLVLDLEGRVELQDKQALYRFCRTLLGNELPGGLVEEMMQSTATALYFAPAILGGAAAIVTGGFGGHDVVWVGTLVTTPVLERLVDRLGKDVREAVVKRWVEEHGASMSSQLERTFLSVPMTRLDAWATETERARGALGESAEKLEALELRVGRFGSLLSTGPGDSAQ